MVAAVLTMARAVGCPRRERLTSAAPQRSPAPSRSVATIHATCEDYRAGATIDLAHDRQDEQRRISCPLLILWSAHGLGSSHDVMAIWREQADNITGHALDCGHFLAEERPAETAAALLQFLDT
jgi:haloacetate dehalogenase